jgi:hypothetical protein
LRCHLRKVAGLTMTSALRQSKNRPRATIANRNVAVVRETKEPTGSVRAISSLRACFAGSRENGPIIPFGKVKYY